MKIRLTDIWQQLQRPVISSILMDLVKKEKYFFDPYCSIHTHLAYNWSICMYGPLFVFLSFFSSQKGWPFNGHIDAAILPRAFPSFIIIIRLCVYMCSCYNLFHCYCRLYSFYWLLHHTRRRPCSKVPTDCNNSSETRSTCIAYMCVWAYKGQQLERH